MSLRALRAIYICAFLFASPIRLATITLIATSKLFPVLFALQYQDVFNPSKVLNAAAITPSTKMASLADGVLLLMQYDEMISATVLLLWSSGLCLRASTSERSAGKWMVLLWRCFLMWAVAGPVGVVIFCLWARDEAMYARAEESERKKCRTGLARVGLSVRLHIGSWKDSMIGKARILGCGCGT